MEEQKTIIYQEALERRIVEEDDYFLIQYPDGRNVLFRLVKREERYVMWGPPTNGKNFLAGRKGYDNLFALADAQVRKEYSIESVIKEIHSLGFSDREYHVNSFEEFRRIMDEEESIHNHIDDAEMEYILTSRCVCIGRNYEPFLVRTPKAYTYFRTFVMYRGILGYYDLYISNNSSSFDVIGAVRPEAIPNPTMLLSMRGRDGSKANPWICLSSHED